MTGSNAATLRRIVTCVDDGGRSRVAIDGPPDAVLEFGPGTGLYEIWTDDGATLDRHDPPLHQGRPVRLSPPPGGVTLRWFTVAPIASSAPAGETEAFFAAAFASMDAVHERADTTRHPGMHQTKTLDCIVVVRGAVRLILDDDERLLSPGDVVVQRGTSHAWLCESDTPALLVAVLIDRDLAA